MIRGATLFTPGLNASSLVLELRNAVMRTHRAVCFARDVSRRELAAEVTALRRLYRLDAAEFDAPERDLKSLRRSLLDLVQFLEVPVAESDVSWWQELDSRLQRFLNVSAPALSWRRSRHSMQIGVPDSEERIA